MSQRTIQKLKKKSDLLWSQVVRARDRARCQIRGCGRSPAFAHHIFSRWHLATRWDPLNGFTICWGHHKKGHVDHEWLRDEIIAVIGQEIFDVIKDRAGTIQQIKEADLLEIIESLSHDLKEYYGRNKDETF